LESSSNFRSRHYAACPKKKGMPYKRRFTRGQGDWFRKRQWRALRAVLLIGLVCAASLLLVVYLICHRKMY
jgi:hypothetical protein